jgi:beta-galactosidase GanA
MGVEVKGSQSNLRSAAQFSYKKLWFQIRARTTRFLLSALLVSLSLAAAFPFASLEASASTPGKAVHTVTFDHYSLIVDGKRAFIYSGEFHPFRLPSPDLWRDVFEKMEAAGFNTVSCYFDWGYHSPAPGVYDFSGVRNLDKFLDAAAEAGLYVIARPGPYINAETDSGGFPGWLTTIQGRARSTAPDYLANAQEWLSHIDPIIARHQLTNGTGTVIACQVENEFYDNSSGGQQYMQHLENKMRSDGITVPLTGNHNATFVQGLGATDIPGFDIYPQEFDAANPARWNRVPMWLEGAHRSLPSDKPLYLSELQGGSFDPWRGPGYAACYALTGPNFENVFYKWMIAQGATMINLYMTYGGTSWGWLPYPGVYSSYDYGAAIDEARQLTGKFSEQKLIAAFTQAVPSLTKTQQIAPHPPTNPGLSLIGRANPDDQTEIFLLSHTDATSATTEQTHITVDLSAGTGIAPAKPGQYYGSVPQEPGTAISVNGRDAKLLLANYRFGKQHLIYSTSQLMTNGEQNLTDFAVFYDNRGDDGETVLRYSSEPNVEVLEGNVRKSWDGSCGDLRLNYVHQGLARVLVHSGNGDLLLLLADTATAGELWKRVTKEGPVLVRGPYLVRAAELRGNVLALRGDTNAPTKLSVLFPPSIGEVRWIGSLEGPPLVNLPSLTNWKFKFAAPERNPGFDDTDWTIANHTTTNNPIPPGTLPVLYEDDYGFHHGSVWYRGHFTAAGSETGITIDGETGGRGVYAVWLNGALLGTEASGPKNFNFPTGILRKGKDNTIAVLVMNIGHDEDFAPTDGYKSPRGIRTAILHDANTPIKWRIQGVLAGEQFVDRVRGPLNNGGLYGERHGWFLPGYPDACWANVSLPHRWSAIGLPAGLAWYRTAFDLHLPKETDVPLGLEVTDDPARHYRALIFLNGWMMGIYANDLGPQRIFSLPTGILNPNGGNTLAIAVLGEDGPSAGLGQISLIPYGRYQGGVPVGLVDSPQWNAETWGQPGMPSNFAVGLTADRHIVFGGETLKVKATISNPADHPAEHVALNLRVPAGWTVAKDPTVEFLQIAPGQAVSNNWSVQVPMSPKPGKYQLAAIADYRQDGEQEQTTADTADLEVPSPLHRRPCALQR